MTEYEQMYLISENLNQNIEIWKFWSSVSFGYMALSHFTAKQLNIFIITFLTVLYLAFTGFIVLTMGDTWETGKAYTEMLSLLSESDNGISLPAQAWLSKQDGAPLFPFLIAFFGTFIGALLYLPYRYFVGRREDT